MSIRRVVLAVLLAATAGCDESATAPEDVIYTIEVSGERFRIRVTDPLTIADLEERRMSGTEGVVMGRVAVGDDGYNSPWTWHLVPASIEVPDVTIELCDGRPSMVEAQRDEWIADVKNFCPWGARVVERTTAD
jgi:hypothetical protein